jgi:hypothetical protein
MAFHCLELYVFSKVLPSFVLEMYFLYFTTHFSPPYGPHHLSQKGEKKPLSGSRSLNKIAERKSRKIIKNLPFKNIQLKSYTKYLCVNRASGPHELLVQ